MKLLVIDFETKDPYISLGLGAGWVYKLKVDTSIFRTIGFSYLWLENGKVGPSTYLPARYDTSTHEVLKALIVKADAVIMHNATYDLGCLLTHGIDISKLKVFDTKVIAKLYKNTLASFSLDDLSKKFLPTSLQKKQESLINIVKKFELLRTPNGRPVNSETKTYIKRAKSWAYRHMDILQEKDFDSLAYYACQDAISTAYLFIHFTKLITLEQAEYWSSFQKRIVKLRSKGLKIDLDHIRKHIPGAEKDIRHLKHQICSYVTLDGNIITEEELDSPTKLAKCLLKMGYDLPASPAGGYSTSSKWMSVQNDSLLNLIIEYRTVKLILRDFLIKPLEFQEYTCPDARLGGRYGWLFPEYTIFGAVTGRFSSSGPNIQQIPKRNKKWGRICRAMFQTSDPAKTWFSLDWANQEGRLQVHYGIAIGGSGAAEMRGRFEENPGLDLHQTIADLAKITRSNAKNLNLGLSYGMGFNALIKFLGVSEDEGREVLEKYYNALPFLKELSEVAKQRIKDNGYIITIGGRRLYNDPYGYREDGSYYDKSYKSLNKIMQGGGSDFMYDSFAKADDAGLDIKCIVHDEFCIEGTLEDALKLKHIMENSYPLNIPMLADIKGGCNWGDLEAVDCHSSTLQRA